MPSTVTWVGGTSGDFNTAANWDTAAVPIAGDSIVFDRGIRNLDTNLDQSAITFANISFRKAYGGQAGNSVATPFKFGVSGKLLIEGGGSRLYLSGGTIVTTIMRGAGSDFNREVHLAGTLTTVIFQRGTLYLESGTTTTMIVDPLQDPENPSSGCVCYAVTPTVTTLHTYGGNVIMQSAGTITTLNCVAGLVQVDTGTLTTCNLMGPSAKVDWRTATTLTTLNVYKGIFDASESAQSRTITNSTLYQGGTMDLYNGLDNITRTNPTVKYGGNIIDVAGTYSLSP